MKDEFKLNPWAEEFVPLSRCHLSASAPEFVPLSRCHLSASAPEFVPSSNQRLSAATPEFFPRGHVHHQPNTVLSRQFIQAQRSRAHAESSHAVSLKQAIAIHYSSN